MANTSSNNSGGVGICGVMFIVFLVLKLVGTIDWSWWWITSPLWIPFGVLLIVMGLIGIAAGIVALFSQ